MKKTFWTSQSAERMIDGLVTVLFTLGLAQPLFFLRSMDTNGFEMIGLSLLCAAVVFFFTLRWWVFPVFLTIGTLGLTFFFLHRLDTWELWINTFSSYGNWAANQLLLGGPEPDSIFWMVSLRFLIILAITIPVYLLIRKSGQLIVFAIIVLLVSIPFLFAYPDELALLLPAVGGLIVLLPVSLVRTLKKQHPRAAIPRAPLQWLALPIAIISILLGQFITPDDTRHWRQQDWINRLTDFADFWQNQTGSVRGWQPFNLSSAGFHSTTAQLGGPIRPNDHIYLTVETPRSVLLRGVTRTQYTGHSWQSSPHQVYRLNSPLWQLTRRQVFAERLLSGQEGKRFTQQYTESVQLFIKPYSRLQTTLFVPSRFDSLSWEHNRDHPPYFTIDGDLFVFGSLPGQTEYTAAATVFLRDKPGFSEAIQALTNDPSIARDPYWQAIRERYLDLPEELPALVEEKAQAITEGLTHPYLQAERLEQHLKHDYSYTLDAELPPAGMDFIEHFLETEEGYCVHFATTLTVMARTLGLPARYVEGFALEAESRTENLYRATGRTAHAWCEIYFQGIGWLTFDPTPAGRIEPPDEPDEPIVGPIDEPVLPSPEPTPSPLDPIDTDDDELSLAWLIALLASFILLLLGRFLLVWMVKNHWRNMRPTVMRRREPDRAKCLELAYTDVLHQLSCMDVIPETGETLLDFSKRAQNYLRLDGQDVTMLFWPVIRWRYGKHIPSNAELDALLVLRERIETRLHTTLSRGSWFWRRVLAFLIWIGKQNHL